MTNRLEEEGKEKVGGENKEKIEQNHQNKVNWYSKRKQ